MQQESEYKTLRFLISVKEDAIAENTASSTLVKVWKVTITCPTLADEWKLTRKMRKVLFSDKCAFPAVIEEELCNNNCELCKGDNPDLINDVHTSILKRKPDHIRKFGRYLFDALIGETTWYAIKQKAEAEQAKTIELALSWPVTEKNLPRLNWEMMCSAEGFLVAGIGTTNVAITRIVAGVRRTARKIALPPRILFVVGTSLFDPVIKPGAEYLGLLRQLKQEEGCTIYSRVLENASPDRMKAAIESFHPDVVHFICHGKFVEQDGRGYLELFSDNRNESNQKRFFSGEQLAPSLFMANIDLPVVVLSACESATGGSLLAPSLSQSGPGQLLGAHDTASLAAELVQGGIPIVIGMAGKVSDLACRLFTRQFGVSLVRGLPLIAATAMARRATFAQVDARPDASVDWAFPAVFLADSEELSTYAPVRQEGNNSDEKIENWIKDLNIKRPPVFCGRTKVFQDYYDFLNSSERGVLGIEVTRSTNHDGEPLRLGKTRLLQELTMQALRDRHLPCLVTIEKSIPTDVMQLGKKIFDAIRQMRVIINLPATEKAQMAILVENSASYEAAKDDPSLDPIIREELAIEKQFTPKAVHSALKKDLVKLINDARKQEDSIWNASSRVIVLLDGVDQYDKALDALLDTMLGPSGFGTSNEPIPVILAFSSDGVAQSKLKPPDGGPSWLKRSYLEPFVNGEDMLAYCSMLLYPNVGRIQLNPYVIDESKEDTFSMCQRLVQRVLKGIPGHYATSLFKDVVDLSNDYGWLKVANDEDIIRNMVS